MSETTPQDDHGDQARPGEWLSPGGVRYRIRVDDRNEDALLAGEDYSRDYEWYEPVIRQEPTP